MIVGIGGVSLAGKSKLASEIMQHLPDKGVAILCQDNFVFPSGQILKIKDHIDWECPESIDFDRFYDAVKEGCKNNDLVIAEGLMAFHDEKVNDLYQKKIFIEIHKAQFKKRKTIDTRWGIEPEWYIEHIWESYLKYGQIPVGMKDILVLKGNHPIDMTVVINYLYNLNNVWTRRVSHGNN
jgi:uridine kinase